MSAPSTKDIVRAYASAIKIILPELKYNNDFEAWKDSVNKKENEFKKILDSRYVPFIPLRTEVLKLVVKELYHVMPYSKEYIVNKYSFNHHGIQSVYFPSKNKRLIISFTGFINYVSFARLSWYFDETEQWNSDTSYLFLCDPSRHWYVGEENNATGQLYEDIITKIMHDNHFTPQQVSCIGASMGGYAALYFSLKLKLNACLAVHAQLNKRAARLYEKDIWDKKIAECGRNFYDIIDLAEASETLSNIYLEYGKHPSDLSGLDELIIALSQKNSLLVLKSHNSRDHNTTSPDRQTIKKYIELFEI